MAFDLEAACGTAVPAEARPAPTGPARRRSWTAASASALLLGLAAFLAWSLSAQPVMADRLAGLVADCSGLDAEPRALLTLCEQALEADDGRLGPENRAAVHYNAGVAALDMGRAVQAQGHFDAAIALAPAMAPAWVSRGLALGAQGRVEEAVESYGRAIAADPSAPGPYLARGRLQAEQGRFEPALADYTAALEREPDWEASYFERARVFAALGRWREAEQDFSAVIARRPRDPAAWLGRAEARAANGIAAARNDFDRAVLLAPEWGAAHYARGLYLEAADEAEAAGADFLRAYELGHSAPDLLERVRALSGG
ncbi:MAG: tetratricopeptide repeat protein [Pseudomonadota bacterium]